MLAAVPIAVYHQRRSRHRDRRNSPTITAAGTDGTWHDLSGWLVYLVALLLLLGVNLLLKAAQRRSEFLRLSDPGTVSLNVKHAIVVTGFLMLGGIAVNYFATRSEIEVPRASLSTLSTTLGDWKQRGSEIKFSEDVEKILRTTDYTMREYTDPSGRVANAYVGYYAPQRTGATYHSPQNCLPSPVGCFAIRRSSTSPPPTAVCSRRISTLSRTASIAS